MTQAEFGCSFLTGTKKKSTKKVEELKQESEYAELLCQIEQEKEDLITLKAALTAQKAALDAEAERLQAKGEMLYNVQTALSELRENLEQREKAVQDLEEQKKAVLQEREAIRQKEVQLDEAFRAVSEIPPLDECVEKVLDAAFVTYIIPGTKETMNFVARRFLERLQEDQKERAEEICKPVRRAVPEYTFDIQQPEDGMEF